jgi:Thioredoxin
MFRIIKITADGCTPCTAQSSAFFQAKEIFEKPDEVSFHVESITVNPHVVKNRSITKLPTVIVEHRGREVDRLTGASSEALFNMLKYYLAK